MREILVAASLAATGIGPAAAADWGSYGNARRRCGTAESEGLDLNGPQVWERIMEASRG